MSGLLHLGHGRAQLLAAAGPGDLVSFSPLRLGPCGRGSLSFQLFPRIAWFLLVESQPCRKSGLQIAHRVSIP